MPTMEIPTNKTIMRNLERSWPDRSFVIVHVGLNKLDGNAESYWSATADIYEPRGTWSGLSRYRNDREADAAGMMHDELLRAFPKLTPIVALHLSGPDGVPMHAVANGRYHIEQGNPEAAARLLRCTVDELPAPEDIEAYVEAQRERWAAESRAAYELLLTL